MMENILKDLNPQSVFEQFEAFSRIPRGSFNNRAAADYCADFARQHGCPVIRDEADNLIITIPASPEYEGAPAVILQGHLDMVCEKCPESDHDFTTDPLSLMVESDDVTADGTTLGADDGIAVAMLLALMADRSIPHGKLYAVLTTDEEVGMLGASVLDCSPMADAKYMINLDDEQEGELITGCAGGGTLTATYPLRFVKAKGLHTVLTVSGLDGGHSGDAIDRFGYNANCLLAEILTILNQELNISIIALNGGAFDNVIPQTASAEILIGLNQCDALIEKCAELTESFKKINGQHDQGLTISAEFGEVKEYFVFGRDSEQQTLFAVTCGPNGVQSMGHIFKGQVDASLNLGVMRTEDKTLTLRYLARSHQEAALQRIFDRLTEFTAFSGGTTEISGSYPAWPYREHSKLQQCMTDVWERLYASKPEVKVIHAAVECGVFSQKLPHLDIVAIGPTITGFHTPDERLSIASTGRIWDYLCAVLAELKD